MWAWSGHAYGLAAREIHSSAQHRRRRTTPSVRGVEGARRHMPAHLPHGAGQGPRRQAPRPSPPRIGVTSLYLLKGARSARAGRPCRPGRACGLRPVPSGRQPPDIPHVPTKRRSLHEPRRRELGCISNTSPRKAIPHEGKPTLSLRARLRALTGTQRPPHETCHAVSPSSSLATPPVMVQPGSLPNLWGRFGIA